MRHYASLFINEIVRLFLHSYPELRYIQALFALGIIDQEPGFTLIVDRFYEEPVDTLKRCKERITKFLESKHPDKVAELNKILGL